MKIKPWKLKLIIVEAKGMDDVAGEGVSPPPSAMAAKD